ncbi:hypothetical protein [Testudinibacter aquarius]|uniref:Uncharacterized protein n=1 Tax=Testudinibacter aquarius TaxID=1524974 RepID=A0ABY2XTN8_9PAST|nr:hypothetical protein [Testudinibacter aquarius]TNG91278.1 hypothetical protein FHQ21_08235 [Testudinibacter aquarius]
MCNENKCKNQCPRCGGQVVAIDVMAAINQGCAQIAVADPVLAQAVRQFARSLALNGAHLSLLRNGVARRLRAKQFAALFAGDPLPVAPYVAEIVDLEVLQSSVGVLHSLQLHLADSFYQSSSSISSFAKLHTLGEEYSKELRNLIRQAEKSQGE